MRTYLHINLADHSIEREEFVGKSLGQAGRYFIAKTLLDGGVAKVDPLAPENPLIFSAGPFAGTNFSNGNRLSVGCKSPLTGGIKEANSGGTFAFALGQLEIAGFTLNGASNDWVIVHIPQDGPITFDSADGYMGMGNIETAKKLHEKYGDKVSIGLCGPVGEYQGLLAGIAFSDAENRPVRLAARGGVGAVMGSKKVKAIIVEKHKMPPLHDRKGVMSGVKQYGKLLNDAPPVQAMKKYGTAMMADYTNHIGGLPTLNFSSGQVISKEEGRFKAGGDFIHELNSERGGDVSHACMPGCLIKCSNIYVDKDGNELVSPLEYETISLLGTNCGLYDPDDIARMNYLANDLGVDTIEVGATIAVLMEAGEGEFGDKEFMNKVFADLMSGNERGRLLAQGTARVGEHYGADRVPVIKKQAISAYDPRVIEVTAVSMMVTAQGADHTAGNLPTYKSDGKSVADLAQASYEVQIASAVADSLGLCIFGRSVTDENLRLIADAINAAHDAGIEPDDISAMARNALVMEHEFNVQAGFTEADDELPVFFTTEPLEPTNKVSRLRSAEVNKHMQPLLS